MRGALRHVTVGWPASPIPAATAGIRTPARPGSVVRAGRCAVDATGGKQLRRVLFWPVGRSVPGTASCGTSRPWVPDPVEIVTDVLDRLRWHASASPSVMHAALTLIERLGATAHAPALMVALTSQIGLLRDAFVTAGHHAHDVDRLDLRAVSVSQNMPHC